MPEFQNIYVSAICRDPIELFRNAGFTLPNADLSSIYLKSDLVFNSEHGLSGMDMQEIAGKAWELMSAGIGRVKAMDIAVSPFLSKLTPDLNHYSLANGYANALRFFDPSLTNERMIISISDFERSFTLFLEEPSEPSKCHGVMLASNSKDRKETYYAILDGGEVEPTPLLKNPFGNEMVTESRSQSLGIEDDKMLKIPASIAANQINDQWSMGNSNMMYSEAEEIRVEEDAFEGIKF